jgi:hypothetical protein
MVSPQADDAGHDRYGHEKQVASTVDEQLDLKHRDVFHELPARPGSHVGMRI